MTFNCSSQTRKKGPCSCPFHGIKRNMSRRRVCARCLSDLNRKTYIAKCMTEAVTFSYRSLGSFQFHSLTFREEPKKQALTKCLLTVLDRSGPAARAFFRFTPRGGCRHRSSPSPPRRSLRDKRARGAPGPHPCAFCTAADSSAPFRRSAPPPRGYPLS